MKFCKEIKKQYSEFIYPYYCLYDLFSDDGEINMNTEIHISFPEYDDLQFKKSKKWCIEISEKVWKHIIYEIGDMWIEENFYIDDFTAEYFIRPAAEYLLKSYVESVFNKYLYKKEK